ncbi:hypothetical protein PQR05_29515 [Paraburkholderia sediminicola]|uniref:hypothetical protein n=1 Tax=Paraburkholderia sediminicola TaxID=458836 RepID=UPI0038B6EAAC
MKLTELAQSQSWSFGLVLDEEDLDKQAMNAARHYLGWGRIASIDGPIEYDNPTGALFTPRTLPYRGPSDFPDVIYAGGIDYGDNPPAPPAPTPDPAPLPVLALDTQITVSEWALVKPLFLLYVERENARALEASRMQGVDVYGRAVTEIQTDIERYENGDMARLAFFQPSETI